MTVWYEKPEACAVYIGTQPYQIRVGGAWGQSRPCIVIWKQLGEADQWADPILLPADAGIGLLVSEAISWARITEEWAKEKMTPDERAWLGHSPPYK